MHIGISDDWTHWLFAALGLILLAWALYVIVTEWLAARRVGFFGKVRPYDYEIDGECDNSSHVRLVPDTGDWRADDIEQIVRVSKRMAARAFDNAADI